MTARRMTARLPLQVQVVLLQVQAVPLQVGPVPLQERPVPLQVEAVGASSRDHVSVKNQET